MSLHSVHSSFREKLIEHLLVGEFLKYSWQRGECSLQVSRPEIDDSGYDLIMEENGIIRHIQLKASYLGAKRAKQTVHLELSSKPSGCVVWVYFDENTMALGPFLFFGGDAGEPLPGIEREKVAKHTKGDQFGHKAERENHRVINKGRFQKIDSIAGLWSALFE